MQDMIYELALEIQAETDTANQGDTFSETGSTAAPTTMAGGIWQLPSSSSGTWLQSSSGASGSTAASISWSLVPSGQMEPVLEIDDEG